MIAARPPRWRRSPSPYALALAIVWLAALGLRLYGLNWDEGQDLHPDELFVARIVLVDRIDPGWPPDVSALWNPATSPLNPRSNDPSTGMPREFAYGALPLFVTDAVAGLMSLATGTDWNGGERVYLVGRVLSALLDAGTVLVVAAMARRLAGPWAGVAAALVAALTPMMIQLAHFFTTDSWLTFFVAVCLALCLRAVDEGALRWLVLAGAAAGLAMATKGSVAVLFGVVALTGMLQSAGRKPRNAPAFAADAAPRVVIAAVAAVTAFAVFEPYAIAAPAVYLQSLRTQADIVRGTFDVPFTRVFVGTTPLDAFGEWFRWGYGPAASTLALAGLVLLVRRAWRDRGGVALPLLVWVAGYALVVGVAEVRFLRYLAPLTPVLAVAAGLALDRLRRWSGRGLATGQRLAGAALVGVALWTVAFVSVYAGEHPRLAASRWLFASAPPGSGITAEYWDDALPRDFGVALSPAAYRFAAVSVDLYADLPPADASARLFDDLSDADFLVLSSNRVESATGAAPWRYPVQNALYRALTAGRLGFVPVGHWDDPPRLGPLRFDDRNADESFVNYDHPTVRMYARQGDLDRSAWDAEMAWAVAQPWAPVRREPAPSLLLDRPVGELPVVADAAWSAGITANPAAATVAWVLLLVGMQLAGLPLARAALPRFADRGWGLARLLAWLVAGYAVWLAASLDMLAFRAIWCWAAVVAVAAVGWVLARRHRVAGSLLPRLPAERGAEIVFWGVFALFLAFRLLNPDGWHPIWGGEKPMEFAHLNATLRSAHFPPYDPWFSDGIVNYYYYGLYLVAFAIKLTGIPADIAFNLAQPTVMAILASGLFSVGAALGHDLTRRQAGGVFAGAGAVAFGVLAGNLSSAAMLLRQTAPPSDSFVDWVWNGSRAIDGAITEFPFFTGLYADLHAHVVALPITVLAIALAYGLVRNRISRWPGAMLRFGLLALALGTLSATNAWDVPTYAMLAVAALWMTTEPVRGWRTRLAAFAAAALGLAVVAYGLFLPFHARFVALFGSLAPVREPTDLRQWATHAGGLGLVSSLGLLALLARRRSGAVAGTPAVVGVALLALFAVAVGWRVVVGAFPGWFSGGAIVLAVVLLAAGAWQVLPHRREPGERWVNRLPVIVGSVVALAALASDRDVLALALAALMLSGVGWLFAGTSAVRFVCLLTAAAWGVVAGVELVVVADDLIGTSAYRMNTVFKFYNQVWVLLALSAAAGVAGAVARLAGRSWVRVAESPVRGWAAATTGVAVVVLAASAVYPLMATPPRLAQRFPEPPPIGTLSALGWMDSAVLPSLGYPSGEIRYAGDRAVIDWFNANVPGSPVVAEATIGPYRCNGSRISIGTGLPTILGWERHQQQQRPLAQLEGRAEDVDRLYRSTDPAEKEAILRRYRVDYVVVGDLERAYPVASNECEATNPAAGIAAFEVMVGSVLAEAFRADGTIVYRVLPPVAADRPTAIPASTTGPSA